MPPLRRGMSRKRWAEDFNKAYDALCLQAAAVGSTCINPYAATSPAEFFAVASEYFFSAGYFEKLLSGCSQATDAVLPVGCAVRIFSQVCSGVESCLAANHSTSHHDPRRPD
jgi:hypothetical protein